MHVAEIGVFAVNAGMATYGDKLRVALKSRRLSQNDLAEAIGTTQPTVSEWVGGDVVPSLPFVIKTARFLDLSLDYLLDDEQDEPRPTGLAPGEMAVVMLMRALQIDHQAAMRKLVEAFRDSDAPNNPIPPAPGRAVATPMHPANPPGRSQKAKNGSG